MKIISVGECTLDRYLQQDKVYIGGISLNFAIHAKRSGAQSVTMMSRVAAADFAQIAAKFAQEGIEQTHLYTSHLPTSHQDIVITPNGERIFPPGGYDFGSMTGFLLNQNDLELAQRADVLACALFQQAQRLFDQVMQLSYAGWRVADFLDLSDFDRDLTVMARYLARLKIAFVSADNSFLVRLMALSIQYTQTLIVLTVGENGSAALLNGQCWQQVALPTQVVDTTGCGDAFQAAFTVAYYQTGDVGHALWRGAQQAAQVAQHLGAS